MSRHPYKEMADRINAMKPGTAWRISRRELHDLPGLPDWAITANITTGFERVKESVVGSSFPHLWDFHQEMDGDITVYRKVEREAKAAPRTVSPLRPGPSRYDGPLPR